MNKKILFAELLFVSLVIYAFYSLYQNFEKAPLLLIIGISLLAFFYVARAFYLIVLGIAQKTDSLGLISVFGFFALAFILTGILTAVFMNSMSKPVIIIGLVSGVGCLLVISSRRNKYMGTDQWGKANAMLLRIVFFTMLAFAILRTSGVKFYKMFGPLKNDQQAIELLEDCMIRKSSCEKFFEYQHKTVGERWN
ncbi:MAG: hypothetical protein HKN92_08045 [Chitinophagales bacterium]|nr:hypothetical protein [Chitinophagales bacterium]